jgi:hypothetical protein
MSLPVLMFITINIAVSRCGTVRLKGYNGANDKKLNEASNY